MIPILGGLGAALAWAAATICSSRSSRLVGAGSTLALVMLSGLVVAGPLAAVEGIPEGLDGDTALWLAVLGVGNLVGLALVYSGFRVGKVGVVAPIASTEGAIAALIAVAAGEQLAPGAGATLGVIVVGIVLASMAPAGLGGRREGGRAAVWYAIGAAATFGATLYAAGRVSAELPVAWVLLPSRALGAIALAVPLLLAGRLRVTRAALPFAVAAGLAEIAGLAALTWGAREGIAITVVLSSQYAALAAIAAYLLFRERLAPVQVAGVATIAGGVAALSVLTA